MRAIDVRNLTFSFRANRQEQRILDDVTLHVDAGEVAVLTGPSGSGKSTLLTIIGGLRSAPQGSVEVLGTQLVGAKGRALVKMRRRIGFVFQQHNLSPALNIAQNVQMGLQHSGHHRGKDARGKIEDMARRVGLFEHIHKRPDQLSGGQQQRAGIARALVNRPGLVLADEPTASLDKDSGAAVMQLFDELASEGSAVVLVTHDKRILDQADRVLSLEDGRVVPTADVLIQDAGNTLRKLMRIDPIRLQRMLSFGQALAQVAMADGRVDADEREAMVSALQAQGALSAIECELVVEFALANSGLWQSSVSSQAEREQLAAALNTVAMADDHMSDEERSAIARILKGESAS